MNPFSLEEEEIYTVVFANHSNAGFAVYHVPCLLSENCVFLRKVLVAFFLHCCYNGIARDDLSVPIHIVGFKGFVLTGDENIKCVALLIMIRQWSCS